LKGYEDQQSRRAQCQDSLSTKAFNLSVDVSMIRAPTATLEQSQSSWSRRRRRRKRKHKDDNKDDNRYQGLYFFSLPRRQSHQRDQNPPV
jgi:hypothetical protein